MADKKTTMKVGMKEKQEEIIQKFQLLRNEQRTLMSKITELEQDLNEHKTVIETLEDVSPDRKCARIIGGVLVERTVKEILPALITNRDQLTKVIESLYEKLTAKGKELNEFREKHGIRVRGDQDGPPTKNEAIQETQSQTNQGVLVSNKS